MQKKGVNKKSVKKAKKSSQKTNISQTYILWISLFFLSGLCGLMYQVVWTRLLSLIFGNSTHAIATVLSVFMLGLSLGSFFTGRLIGKQLDLRKAYAGVEIGIGAYALAFLPLLGLIQGLHSYMFSSVYESLWLLTLLRFLLGSLVIFLPTFLMGATVPLLAGIITTSFSTIGRDSGRLYSFNTLGAACGTFLTAFVIMPALGVNWVFVIGGIMNILIGGFVLLYFPPVVAQRHQKSPSPRSKKFAVYDLDKKTFIAVLGAFGLLGGLSMVYENAWSRALVMVFGSSVYAFATMLTAYLVGLGAGSLVMAKFSDSVRNPKRLFVRLVAFIGIWVLVSTPIIGLLPDFFVGIFSQRDISWSHVIFIEFLVCFGLMLGPTTASGACFPLAARILRPNNDEKIGTTIANVYAVNTGGCILGSLITGFYLISAIGLEQTLLLGGALSVIIAASLSLLWPTNELWNIRLTKSTSLYILAIVGFLLLPSWDPVTMNAGVYIYSDHFKEKGNGDISKSMNEYELLYQKEGPSANVAVLEDNEGGRFLRVNGKTDGSTGSDNETQTLLGVLPAIYSDKYIEQAMVIGLGTGITLASLLEYSDVQDVDCLEISSAVRVASNYFKDYNDNAVDSSRVNLHILDGRTWLLSMDRNYGLITSEPSHPWQTGNANLFTKEFFDLAARRLTDDGIFCQWLPYYRMTPQHLKILLRTYTTQFPHVHVWMANTDLLLIGSKSPLKIDYSSLKKYMQKPAVKSRLQHIGIDNPSELLSFFYLDSKAVKKYISQIETLNSDFNPVIEFQAPKIMTNNVDTTIFFDLLKHSYSSKLSLTNCSQKEQVRRKRISDRDKFYQQWQIPREIYLMMKRRSLR